MFIVGWILWKPIKFLYQYKYNYSYGYGYGYNYGYGYGYGSKDENDDYVLLDQQDGNEVMYGDRENDCLVTVFSNGHLIVEESFANIRQTVDSELAKVL